MQMVDHESRDVNAGSPPQAPLCLALVLADYIHRDRATGKRTILGTFSVIFAPELPATQEFVAVYCALTDGRGRTAIELRLVLVDQEGDQDVARAEGEIDFTDPQMVVEIDMILRGLVFPKAGEYRFQLLGAGEMLMERRLVVIESVSEQGEGND
jgi:hypothetical protein